MGFFDIFKKKKKMSDGLEKTERTFSRTSSTP